MSLLPDDIDAYRAKAPQTDIGFAATQKPLTQIFDEYQKEAGMRSAMRNAQSLRKVPNFSDPRSLGAYGYGAVPEGAKAQAATSAYLKLDTQSQMLIDLEQGGQPHIAPVVYPTWKDSTDAEKANIIYGDTSKEAAFRVSTIMNAGTDAEKKGLEEAYIGALHRQQVADVQNRQFSNDPNVQYEMAVAQSKLNRTLEVGDSLIRRGVNALVANSVSLADSAYRGTQQGVNLISNAAGYAWYNAIGEGRKFEETVRPMLRENWRDLQLGYVPRSATGGNLFEDAIGAGASFAGFVSASLISPWASAALLYSTSTNAVADSMGDVDPLTGLAVIGPMAVAHGLVNKIGLGRFMKVYRNPGSAFASRLAEGVLSESISEGADNGIELAAYGLGGWLTGDDRPIPTVGEAVSSVAYAGLLGGISAGFAGMGAIPSALRARSRIKAFRNVWGDAKADLVEMAKMGSLALDRGIDQIEASTAKYNLPRSVYVRAADVKVQGEGAIANFVRETGLTQEVFNKAVAEDTDIEVSARALLRADALAIVESGVDPVRPLTPAQVDSRAKVYADVMDPESDETPAALAQKVVAARTILGYQDAEGSESKYVPLIEAIRNAPDDGTREAKVDMLREALDQALLLTPSKSLGDLARPDQSAPTIRAVQEGEARTAAMYAEMQAKETLSRLDEVQSIQQLRADLRKITKDDDYVSANMQAMKVLVKYAARAAGMDAVEYANTFAVRTMLSPRYLDQIRKTAAQYVMLNNAQTGVAEQQRAEREQRAALLEQRADQIDSQLARAEQISGGFLRAIGLDGALAGVTDAVYGQVKGRSDALRAQAAEARQEPLPYVSPEDLARQREANGVAAWVEKLDDRSFNLVFHPGEARPATIPHEMFHAFIELMRQDAPDVVAQFESLGTEEELARGFEQYLLEGESPSWATRDVFKAFKTFLGRVPDANPVAAERLSEPMRDLFDGIFAEESQLALAREMSGLRDSLVDSMKIDETKKAELKAQESRVRATQEDRRKDRIVKRYLEMSPELHEKFKTDAENEVNARPSTLFYNEIIAREAVDVRGLQSGKYDDPRQAIRDVDALAEIIAEISPELTPMNQEMTMDEALQMLRTMLTPRQSINMVRRMAQQAYLAEVTEHLPNDYMGELVVDDGSAILFDNLQAAIDAEILKSEKARLRQTEVRAKAAAIRDAARADMAALPFPAATNYRTFLSEMKRQLVAFRNASMKDDKQAMSDTMNRARAAQEKVKFAIAARDLSTKMKRVTVRGTKSRFDPSKVQAEFGDAAKAITSVFINNAVKIPQSILKTDPAYTGTDTRNVKGWTDPGVDRTVQLHPTLQFPSMGTLFDLEQQIPGWIRNLNGGKQTKLSNLTYQQVIELDRTLDQLQAFGKNTFDSAQFIKYQGLNDLKNEAVARINNIKVNAGRPDDYRGAESWGGIARKYADMLGTFSLQLESRLRVADGNPEYKKEGWGPLTSLFQMMKTANSRGAEMSRELAEEVSVPFNRLRESYFKNFDSIRPLLGELPDAMKKRHGAERYTPEMVLMIALYSGTERNLHLLNNAGLSYEMIEQVWDTFSPENKRDIQEVWDIIGKLFPLSQEVLYRTQGTVAERALPLPRTFADGTEIRGGYFPAATESNGSESTLLNALFGARGSEAIPGFMKTRRDQGSNLPAKLDRSVLVNLIDSETHYIATGELAQMYMKLVNDKDFKAAWISKFGRGDWEDLVEVGNQFMNPQAVFAGTDAGSQMVNKMRSAAVSATLGLNFFSALKQNLDLVPATNEMVLVNKAGLGEIVGTMVRETRKMGWLAGGAGIAVMPKRDAQGRPVISGRVVDPMQLNAMQFAYWKSDRLRENDARADQNIQAAADRVIQGEPLVKLWGKEVTMADVKDGMFYFIRMNDRRARAIAWNTQYQLSAHGRGTFDITEGMTPERVEELAIRDADTISDTMAANTILDMTSGQRKKLVHLFTAFMSSQTRRLGRGWMYARAMREGNMRPRDAIRSIAIELWAQEAMVGGASFLWSQLMGDDEEERKKHPESTFGFLTGVGADAFRNTLASVTSTIPVINLVASFAQGYGITPPALKKLEQAGRDVTKSVNSLLAGQYLQAGLSAVKGVGYFTGIPAGRLTQPVIDIASDMGYTREIRRDGKAYTEIASDD